jgi:hypothetical protein
MESFNKVLSRQQKMMEHIAWRIELARRYAKAFGCNRAVTFTLRCHIDFDVQPEPHIAKEIVQKYQKVGGMPLFALISLQ